MCGKFIRPADMADENKWRWSFEERLWMEVPPEKKVYTLEAECRNCHWYGPIDFPVGTAAHPKDCPVCGVKDMFYGGLYCDREYTPIGDRHKTIIK